AHHLPRLAHEELQESELSRGQRHRTAGPGHGVRRRIQGDVAHAQDRGTLEGAPPDQGPKARQVLTEGERLHQVVVRPHDQDPHRAASMQAEGTFSPCLDEGTVKVRLECPAFHRSFIERLVYRLSCDSRSRGTGGRRYRPARWSPRSSWGPCFLPPAAGPTPPR